MGNGTNGSAQNSISNSYNTIATECNYNNTSSYLQTNRDNSHGDNKLNNDSNILITNGSSKNNGVCTNGFVCKGKFTSSYLNDITCSRSDIMSCDASNGNVYTNGNQHHSNAFDDSNNNANNNGIIDDDDY